MTDEQGGALADAFWRPIRERDEQTQLDDAFERSRWAPSLETEVAFEAAWRVAYKERKVSLLGSFYHRDVADLLRESWDLDDEWDRALGGEV